MTRPAFVATVDERTPAVVVPAGDRLLLQRLEPGTQLLYPADPVVPDGPSDPRERVGEALAASDVPGRLGRQTRLTVVVADPTGPFPAPAGADVRRLMVEELLDAAAAAGTEDVVVIAANGLLPRPTEACLDALLGTRVTGALRPDGRLRSHDAEADDLTGPGETAARLVESDLVVVVSAVERVERGAREAAAGLDALVLDLASARAVDAISGRTGDPSRAAETATALAAAVPVVAFRAVLGNPRWSGAAAFLSAREWDLGPTGRLALAAARRTWGKHLVGDVVRDGARADRALLDVAVGDPAELHRRARQLLTEHQAVAAPEPADLLFLGVVHPSRLSPTGESNPVAALAQAAGGLAADPRVLRDGGTLAVAHPLRPRFSTRQHAAAADLWAALPASDAQIAELEQRLVRDPWLTSLYRGQHGFHPMVACHAYWAARRAFERLDRVVWVGARRGDAAALGHKAATRFADALELSSPSRVTYARVTAPVVLREPGES